MERTTNLLDYRTGSGALSWTNVRDSITRVCAAGGLVGRIKVAEQGPASRSRFYVKALHSGSGCSDYRRVNTAEFFERLPRDVQTVRDGMIDLRGQRIERLAQRQKNNICTDCSGLSAQRDCRNHCS